MTADLAACGWCLSRFNSLEPARLLACSADTNGDDDVQLGFRFPSEQVEVIDTYGEIGVDGSFTGAEFEDGRAERLLVTMPQQVWDVTEWEIVNDNEGKRRARGKKRGGVMPRIELMSLCCGRCRCLRISRPQASPSSPHSTTTHPSGSLPATSLLAPTM